MLRTCTACRERYEAPLYNILLGGVDLYYARVHSPYILYKLKQNSHDFHLTTIILKYTIVGLRRMNCSLVNFCYLYLNGLIFLRA